MSYIDNSQLFSQLPQRNHIPTGSKILVGISIVAAIAAFAWALENQRKLNQEKEEKKTLGKGG
jgi:hypothetical protein